MPITHTYMTALSHDGLNVELDLGVVANPGGDFDEAALRRQVESYFGLIEWQSYAPAAGQAPTDQLVTLVADVIRHEGGPAVSGELAFGNEEYQRAEIRSFAEYAVMAPVLPVENSWPVMTNLWTLLTAVGGGAVTGATLGMAFTPVGALVGVVAGAGSTVLMGASKGVGDAVGHRLGRRILRAGEATDVQAKLAEIEQLRLSQQITDAEATIAREEAMKNFGSG